MSHDQKPVKVRLLDASGEKARRRGDTPPIVIDGKAPVAVAVAVAGSTASGAQSGARAGSLSAAMTGRTGMILTLLFVLGCGAGGAAVAVFFA